MSEHGAGGEIEPAGQRPALTFEAWADLSARLSGLDEEARLDLLDEREIDVEDWTQWDQHFAISLAADVARGHLERAVTYGKKCAAELERRRMAAGLLAPAQEAATETVTPTVAGDGAPVKIGAPLDALPADVATFQRLGFGPPIGPAPPEDPSDHRRRASASYPHALRNWRASSPTRTVCPVDPRGLPGHEAASSIPGPGRQREIVSGTQAGGRPDAKAVQLRAALPPHRRRGSRAGYRSLACPLQTVCVEVLRRSSACSRSGRRRVRAQGHGRRRGRRRTPRSISSWRTRGWMADADVRAKWSLALVTSHTRTRCAGERIADHARTLGQGGRRLQRRQSRKPCT